MEKLQLTRDPILQQDLEEIAGSDMIEWGALSREDDSDYRSYPA